MIISIASGKGGTGKTTVAVSLALALQAHHQVAYLDCDVEEPNGYIFLKPQLTETEDIAIEIPVINEEKCDHCGKCVELCAFNALLVAGDMVLVFPELCHGCGGCSYFCPTGAISTENKKVGTVEQGLTGDMFFAHGRIEVGSALSPPVVDVVRKRQHLRDVTIVDAPPGTSCTAIHSVRNTDFCLLVTEPTPFGLNDLDLAVQMLASLEVPHGVLINRAREDGCIIDRYCNQKNIPVLMKIPLSRKIAEAYSRGVPLVHMEGTDWGSEFLQLYQGIKELVAGARARANQR